MINLYEYTNENKIEHNSKWPYTPDHPYRILIIGGSGSGKTNALLNLINNQPDIDKIYLYTKDLYEAKCQYLINITLLLNIRMICKMSIKILMITIREKNVKY